MLTQKSHRIGQAVAAIYLVHYYAATFESAGVDRNVSASLHSHVRSLVVNTVNACELYVFPLESLRKISLVM